MRYKRCRADEETFFMSNTVKNCFLIETFLYENILRTHNFFCSKCPSVCHECMSIVLLQLLILMSTICQRLTFGRCCYKYLHTNICKLLSAFGLIADPFLIPCYFVSQSNIFLIKIYFNNRG